MFWTSIMWKCWCLDKSCNSLIQTSKCLNSSKRAFVALWVKSPPPLKQSRDKETWKSKNLDNAKTISLVGVCMQGKSTPTHATLLLLPYHIFLKFLTLFGLLTMEVLSNKIQLSLFASLSCFWEKLRPGINMPLIEIKVWRNKTLIYIYHKE